MNKFNISEKINIFSSGIAIILINILWLCIFVMMGYELVVKFGPIGIFLAILFGIVSQIALRLLIIFILNIRKQVNE